MGKILAMQERGQFDALSQGLEMCDENKGTDETSLDRPLPKLCSITH